MDFEASLKRLDEILEQLSAGGLTLEESVELYREGMELSALCKKELDQAKLKLSEIKPAEESDESEQ